MSVTKVLTKKEVAALLQISEKQVQRLVAEKKLQAQRLGHRTLRFRPESVERYLDRNGA
jgi:excisionase family DNA binding protein